MNRKSSPSTVYQSNVVPLVRPSSATNSSVSDRVVVPGQTEWLLQLADRFEEVTSLPKGWDGYEGVAVSFSCAQFAANLIDRLFHREIDAPQLVPGSDGTVQLEWHENNFDIEVDIVAPYQVVAYRCDLLTGQANEIELSTDYSELAVWITELKNARSATIYNEV